MKRVALPVVALLLLVGCDRAPTVPETPQVLASKSGQGGPPFQEVAAGDGFSCAVNARGDAFCWGTNRFGTLGAGDREGSTTPRSVLSEVGFATIQAAGSHACALGHGGIAYCWGLNSAGEVGVSTSDNCSASPTVPLDCVLQPAPVSGDLRFHTLDAGWAHNCGLTAQGDAYCWGWNEFGQLGTSTNETCLRGGLAVPCSRTPVPVDGGLRFRSISAGFWQTCGITVDEQTYCWGRNIGGAFGNGTIGPGGPTPVPGATGVTLASIASGGNGIGCGITVDRVTVCWGARNFVGEYGDGTVTPHLTPAPTTGDFVPRLIYTMTENLIFPHVCGVAQDGEARCWGLNRVGQLGSPSTEICRPLSFVLECSTVPLTVSGGHRFETITAGSEHTCGVTKSHEVLCWGRNTSGQVGDGTTINRPEPVPVALP